MPWPTSSNNDFTIAPARSATELTSAAALFHAYAASLPIDLSPQGFQQELDSLPGLYAPPGGELLLAKRGDHVLGCIALKPLEPPRIAEFKRLYVRPQARGLGVGKALVAAAQRRRNVSVMRSAGHAVHLKEAIAVQQGYGFIPFLYGNHPYPGLVCLGKTYDLLPCGPE